MKCYINDVPRTSDVFWKEVQNVLTQVQRHRLLDGIPVQAGGRKFQVITDEMIAEQNEEHDPER